MALDPLDIEIVLPADSRDDAVRAAETIVTRLVEDCRAIRPLPEPGPGITCPGDGSLELSLRTDNFRGTLRGLVREGVHGPGGPAFTWLLTSEASVPSIVSAHSRADRSDTAVLVLTAVAMAALTGLAAFLLSLVGLQFRPGWLMGFLLMACVGIATAVVGALRKRWVAQASAAASHDGSTRVGFEAWTAIMAAASAAVADRDRVG